jgi:hypothetical protein
VVSRLGSSVIPVSVPAVSASVVAPVASAPVASALVASAPVASVPVVSAPVAVVVAELPELFQLKCPSPALEARPHLYGNNPSIPRI